MPVIFEGVPAAKASKQKPPPTARFIAPAIPLEHPMKKEVPKDALLTFKLRMNPADEASMTFDTAVPIFSHGTPEELLLFLRKVREVNHGLGATTGQAKFTLIRCLLAGDALAKWNTAAAARGNETNKNFCLTIGDLKKAIFPKRALLMQKRALRRHMRKPHEMTARDFSARLTEIIKYLPEFPNFGAGDGINDNKKMEILEYLVPVAWQKEMVHQGYDPHAANQTTSTVDFCKRMEFFENSDAGGKNNKAGEKPRAEMKSGQNNTGKSQVKSSERGNYKSDTNNKRKREKWCEYHEVTGHDTSECKVVRSFTIKSKK